MFNKAIKEIKDRVLVLEERDRQRRETPVEFLSRKVEFLFPNLSEEKKYKGVDAYFYHNGKRYLITIKEDKHK